MRYLIYHRAKRTRAAPNKAEVLKCRNAELE
jgi:hypothetical protein